MHVTPTRRKNPLLLLGFIAWFNVILIGVCVLLMTSSRVQAQDAGKDENVPDDSVVFDAYPHPFSRGALEYSLADRWNTDDLTFHFDNCPHTIDCNQGQDAVRAGFKSWADLSPLTFTEVNTRQVDIEVTWTNDPPELGSVGGV